MTAIRQQFFQIWKNSSKIGKLQNTQLLPLSQFLLHLCIPFALHFLLCQKYLLQKMVRTPLPKMKLQKKSNKRKPGNQLHVLFGVV